MRRGFLTNIRMVELSDIPSCSLSSTRCSNDDDDPGMIVFYPLVRFRTVRPHLITDHLGTCTSLGV